MSRYDGRDDSRATGNDRAVDHRNPDRIVSKDRWSGHLDMPARHLDLPSGDHRQPVEFRGREYQLNREQSRALSNIGAFRVVPTDDLSDSRSGDTWQSTLKPLADQGLIERHDVVLGQKKSSVVVLTREGKQFLDEHRHERSQGGRNQAVEEGQARARVTPGATGASSAARKQSSSSARRVMPAIPSLVCSTEVRP